MPLCACRDDDNNSSGRDARLVPALGPGIAMASASTARKRSSAQCLWPAGGGKFARKVQAAASMLSEALSKSRAKGNSRRSSSPSVNESFFQQMGESLTSSGGLEGVGLARAALDALDSRRHRRGSESGIVLLQPRALQRSGMPCTHNMCLFSTRSSSSLSLTRRPFRVRPRAELV